MLCSTAWAIPVPVAQVVAAASEVVAQVVAAASAAVTLVAAAVRMVAAVVTAGGKIETRSEQEVYGYFFKINNPFLSTGMPQHSGLFFCAPLISAWL